MKKIMAAFFAGILAAGSAFALDLELSGEIKTGFFTMQREVDGKTYSYARIHNNDGDSGLAEGRVRFGINLQNENIGVRTQFYQQNFLRGTVVNDPNINRVGIDFAYAFCNLFDSRLKISAGLLGESPWGSGGPELLKELEYTGSGEPITGIRFEWKPHFLPGLNLGFVLNREDDTMPIDAQQQFGDILQESIAGAAWEHEYFLLRFAYRFDRDVDSPAAIVSGAKFVYRAEERVLGKLLPGLSVSANGYCEGIGAAGKGSGRSIPGFVQNWLYILYAPESFSAGLDAGYRDGFVNNEQLLEIRPSFFYKFINNLLSAGLTAGMEIGFNGGKSLDDAFYNFWFMEPQLKANISGNFYAAVVYRFTSGVYGGMSSKDQKTNWVNIRLCYAF